VGASVSSPAQPSRGLAPAVKSWRSPRVFGGGLSSIRRLLLHSGWHLYYAYYYPKRCRSDRRWPLRAVLDTKARLREPHSTLPERPATPVTDEHDPAWLGIGKNL
jgi:hypothetical protein